MKTDKKYIIGIDPGVKTGIAVWDRTSKQLVFVETMKLHQALLLLLTSTVIRKEDILVRIENPNLRKWFGNSGRESLQGAGSIKRDFSVWKEFFEEYEIEFQEVAPKNIKTKVDPDYFKKLTGFTGRTSNHARDAAMLAFNF